MSRKSGITLDNEDCDEEITFAVWEKGELIKKTVSFAIFLEELRSAAVKFSKHKTVNNFQKEEIRLKKQLVRENADLVIMHVDFAENWGIILKNEIQSYH